MMSYLIIFKPNLLVPLMSFGVASLSLEFRDYLLSNESFQESYKIVGRNSSGNIWLVGGFLFRNLANKLYGSSKPECDFDFIVENGKNEVVLPSQWSERRNRLGGLKFIRDDGMQEIDMVVLPETYMVREWGLPNRIESYLETVPLNIQSIAYDFGTERIIGDVGLKAMEERRVEVLDSKSADYMVRTKGISLNDIIKEKANSLGFEAIFSMD